MSVKTVLVAEAKLKIAGAASAAATPWDGPLRYPAATAAAHLCKGAFTSTPWIAFVSILYAWWSEGAKDV
jgi:hypothetical protein